VRLSQDDLDEMTEIVTESWRLSAAGRLLASYDAAADWDASGVPDEAAGP
jgi:hypothetical protein